MFTFPSLSCFCEEIGNNIGQFRQQGDPLSLWIGGIGIAIICLCVLLQYFLMRWTCPIREGSSRKIFVLNRTNIGHKICTYLIEVEEELFLIIQTPNQVICEPVRGKAKWEVFNGMSQKEDTLQASEMKPTSIG
ncbi:hypothetical protein [Candidatus Similichlamydia laticola]|nr:hypothetical protein [Candidatus Similichlamydia laticola]